MEDRQYMSRAIDLASRGGSAVSPNPMVGAVIVRDGRIIAEGWHHEYGKSHAERDAIDSIRDKSLLRGSTMYVTLEPCCHYGKTPPCADYIIENGISKVFVGAPDPNPKVDGGGIRKLREAGIEVVTDFMREECENVCRFFLTAQRCHRPYVMLKWAETADGFMGSTDTPVWFTGKIGLVETHRIRAAYDAIMVGTNTAAVDNPSLTVRNSPGRNPLRVVLDRTCRLSPDLNIFNSAAETLVFSSQYTHPSGAKTIPIDFTGNIIPSILSSLFSIRCQSLMVEGGSKLLSSFIESGLYDEVNVFRSSKTSDALFPSASSLIPAPAIPKTDRLHIYNV